MCSCISTNPIDFGQNNLISDSNWNHISMLIVIQTYFFLSWNSIVFDIWCIKNVKLFEPVSSYWWDVNDCFFELRINGNFLVNFLWITNSSLTSLPSLKKEFEKITNILSSFAIFFRKKKLFFTFHQYFVHFNSWIVWTIAMLSGKLAVAAASVILQNWLQLFSFMGKSCCVDHLLSA